MSRWIDVALVAMALGLAGQAAAEVAAPGTAPAQVVAPRTPSAPAARPVTAPAPTTTVLARPLFSPGRRPATPPTAASAPAPPAVPLPRLAGVIGEPWPRAILAPPVGRMVALAVGETLDGRVLRAIGAASVVLEGPDGTRVLPLTADEAVEGTTTAATGPPGLGALALDVAPPGLSPSGGPPPAGAGPEEAVLATIPPDGGGQVRAVLASADAMASAAPPGGCCVPDLGWSRVRRGAPPAPAADR